MNESVQLSGKFDKRKRIWITPNVNEVGATIAVHAKTAGLKKIIFVNKKDDADSTARNIGFCLGGTVELTQSERELWESLRLELGNI